MDIMKITEKVLTGLDWWASGFVPSLCYGNETRSRRISACFFTKLPSLIIGKFYKPTAPEQAPSVIGQLCKYGVATAVAFRVYAFVASSSWKEGYLGRALVLGLYQIYVSKLISSVIRTIFDTKDIESFLQENSAIRKKCGSDLEKWGTHCFSKKGRLFIKKNVAVSITNICQSALLRTIIFPCITPKLLSLTSSPILIHAMVTPFTKAMHTFMCNGALSLRLVKQ